MNFHAFLLDQSASRASLFPTFDRIPDALFCTDYVEYNYLCKPYRAVLARTVLRTGSRTNSPVEITHVGTGTTFCTSGDGHMHVTLATSFTDRRTDHASHPLENYRQNVNTVPSKLSATLFATKGNNICQHLLHQAGPAAPRTRIIVLDNAAQTKQREVYERFLPPQQRPKKETDTNEITKFTSKDGSSLLRLR